MPRAPSSDKLVLRSTASAAKTIVIPRSPFRVGRRAENDLTLLYDDVSGVHAEFRNTKSQGWTVIDLGSTNGTFVNGERVTTPTPIVPGDLLHLGGNGFEVVRPSALASDLDARRTMQISHGDANVRVEFELARLLIQGTVFSHFQPLIELSDRKVFGWEALGRAKTESNLGPWPLLQQSEKVEKADRLSEMFANSAMECVTCGHCWNNAERKALFLNVHPHQIQSAGFDRFLKRIAATEIARRYQLVIEIPESLACESGEMSKWVGEIRTLGMGVAYDDFGKGQSRITELLEVPPDYLKLDIELVAGLASEPAKRTLVKAVIEACETLKVRTIGEGIENDEDLQACLDAGVDIGQGYGLGRPKPAHVLFDIEQQTLPQTCPFVRLQPSG